MPHLDTASGAILLTRRGEERMTGLARSVGEAGATVSAFQLRVLVDDLVDCGDCWTVEPGAGRRVRTLMRAAGLDLAPGDTGAGSPRRIPAADVAASLSAVRATRGLAVAGLARALGAGESWDHLLSFLERADAQQGVVSMPWPSEDRPLHTGAASPRRAGRPRRAKTAG